ncbi:MAG: polysaccharide pyruvyl transferase CsaB [Phascolarctobacterium sp.]|nr:polysaccharide pyruvyl transferase CsaB [Phascolarctobacterium sp.]
MSKIVISGYYGFANAGDEAMLTAIINALLSKDSSMDMTVISGNPDITKKVHKVNSIHRFSLLDIFSAMSKSDLLISGGGSLLQDVTSKRSLFYYLAILTMGTVLSKKVMLFAQGIGPIKSSFMRKITKYVCSSVDLITVRDKDSLYELRRIGVPDNKVLLTADAVMTLAGEPKEFGRKLLDKYYVPNNKMLIAIAVRKWREDDSYLLEIAKAADRLIDDRNAHIVLLPLQYPLDIETCRRVQQLMVNKLESTVLAADCNTEEFLSLIGNFDLLIGMRLHALIFSAVMGVPFVAVSYDPKIDGFVKDVNGTSAGRVSDLEADNIINCCRKALFHKEANKAQMKELREKAMLNAEKAFELLHK